MNMMSVGILRLIPRFAFTIILGGFATIVQAECADASAPETPVSCVHCRLKKMRRRLRMNRAFALKSGRKSSQYQKIQSRMNIMRV